MSTVPMFDSPVVDTRRSIALAYQLRRKYFGTRQFSSRDLAVQHGRHHPCWKTTHFLPCSRPPDVIHLHRPALLSQDDKDFGTKIFENLGLKDFTPAPVTRVGDLLRLRSYFMSQLGLLYLWMIKLSMIEWPTLSAQEKKLHTVIHRSFVTSYVFRAESILQHWL